MSLTDSNNMVPVRVIVFVLQLFVWNLSNEVDFFHLLRVSPFPWCQHKHETAVAFDEK